jgi:hypothetical protein
VNDVICLKNKNKKKLMSVFSVPKKSMENCKWDCGFSCIKQLKAHPKQTLNGGIKLQIPSEVSYYSSVLTGQSQCIPKSQQSNELVTSVHSYSLYLIVQRKSCRHEASLWKLYLLDKKNGV